MAPLPECRVKKGEKAFKITRVDYFGSMKVTLGCRTEKRHGVLFTWHESQSNTPGTRK